MIAMFRDCWSLSSLDLSDWNTANVTNMYQMFQQCSSLQSLSLSGWNTANVTHMSNMFQQCSSLQSLSLSGWNTANVTNMSYMFNGCSGLQSLDLSGWNTSNVEDMSYMFRGCSGLQSLDLSGWNTANVTDMSWMFQQCSSLQSLDLTGWSTSNVEYMSGMFRSCSGLQSLDLTGWNTSNVEDMSGMFYGCSGLTTIYAGEGWNTYNVWDMSDMFEYCTSLVGGMGTTYDAYHTDGEYARIDRGPNSDQPGYFTGRFTKEIAGYEDNESGWYLIASPLAADIAPTAVTNMTNETFDLYYFDQTGGTNGKEWKNWKNEGGDGYHFNLEPGKGYLYAHDTSREFIFTGTPYSGSGVIPLEYTANKPLSGWNLIGNPFAGTANLPNGLSYYTLNEGGSELAAGTAATIGAMEAIFVKANGENESVTFTAQSRNAEGNANAILALNLTSNSNGLIDRAIVRFDEGSTLPKFMINENHTKIYIPQDGEDYAVVNAENQGELPLNFKAEKNGNYTLSFSNENVEFGYLHLIDNMTGTDVDLLANPSYSFEAKTYDYTSRFKLVFATGNASDDNFAFFSNGELVINNEGNAVLQVIDVNGRILKSESINGCASVKVDAAPGVYMLRLINGENVKVQKVVVE
jgi:surface protein